MRSLTNWIMLGPTARRGFTVGFPNFQLLSGNVVIWAQIGEDRQRFDIAREVLNDCVGDYRAPNTEGFC